MKTHVIAFRGNGLDEYGMPVPYYYYGVFVSLLDSSTKSYNTTVISISGIGAPDIERVGVEYADSEADALMQTIRRLVNHPAHKGLFVEHAELRPMEI